MATARDDTADSAVAIWWPSDAKPFTASSCLSQLCCHGYRFKMAVSSLSNSSGKQIHVLIFTVNMKTVLQIRSGPHRARPSSSFASFPFSSLPASPCFPHQRQLASVCETLSSRVAPSFLSKSELFFCVSCSE